MIWAIIKFTQFRMFIVPFGQFNVHRIHVRSVQCSYYKFRHVILMYMNKFLMLKWASKPPNMILYSNSMILYCKSRYEFRYYIYICTYNWNELTNIVNYWHSNLSTLWKLSWYKGKHTWRSHLLPYHHLFISNVKKLYDDENENDNDFFHNLTTY